MSLSVFQNPHSTQAGNGVALGILRGASQFFCQFPSTKLRKITSRQQDRKPRQTFLHVFGQTMQFATLNLLKGQSSSRIELNFAEKLQKLFSLTLRNTGEKF